MYNIALVGNPNSGKTTLFNKLTGANQHIGNWPGVTVEKKEGFFYIGHKKISIADLPGIYSLAPYSPEEVITRNFVLREAPDLILNIIDASNLERNLYLSTQITEIGIPVIFILNMIDVADRQGFRIDTGHLEEKLGYRFIKISASRGSGIKELIACISESIDEKKVTDTGFRYFSDDIVEPLRKIHSLIPEGTGREFISIKLFENDPEIMSEGMVGEEAAGLAESLREEAEGRYKDDIESVLITQRYDYVSALLKECLTKETAEVKSITEKIDGILMNRYLALPLFLLIMYLIFSSAFGSATTFVVEAFESFISGIFKPWVKQLLESAGASGFSVGLLTDGIIDGVGAVIVFTPQLVVLFFFISLLEDSGYMARAALLTDRILRKMGLTGKSFIPFVIGFGCSVPAIMAVRTLDSEKDRKLTIFLAPFMSCGARAPVYAMIASAYFSKNKSAVIFSIYLAGILVAIFAGLLLSKTVFRGEEAPFVLELPKYQAPKPRSLLRHTFARSKEFVRKAGTIILVASAVVWVLTSLDPSFRMVADPSGSLLSVIGRSIAVVFRPLGFGSWIPSVAIMTGIFAKESVVSTVGILTGQAGLGGLFTPLTAYSFLIFILFYVPCVASIGAMRRELNSFRWTAGAVLFQTSTAWIMSFLVFNAGRLVGIG